ncbi:MAG: aspartate aminotransferase family protein [Spirochaetes bacterium]|nr:aspartate aminotransferase family protein [Spirochaetota bacterium]
MTSKKLEKIIRDDGEFLFQNYGRLPVCFVRGKGAYLYDQDGKRYIDLFCGIAVTNFGHMHQAITKRMRQQIDSIVHSSNWFYNQEQIQAAKVLSELTFPGKTLFVNSGAEANEAAIKLVRRYGLTLSRNRYKIISFNESFHGRTFGSMSATAQKKIHDGFGPIVPGFIHLPFNDINAVRREIKRNRDIAGVFIELVQGEGGIRLTDRDYLKELFSLCNKNHIVTVIDEVQTGMGRTGRPFAYQYYGVIPDVITLAKGLAGGLPIGAVHAKSYLAEVFDKGRHGSTFGGNHVSCAAAAAALGEMKKKSFFANIQSVSDYIFAELSRLKEKYPIIREVRGMGLHIGVELTKPGLDIVKKALTRGLIINCTSENVIRIMPPLTIPLSVVKEGMKVFTRIIEEEGDA